MDVSQVASISRRIGIEPAATGQESAPGDAVQASYQYRMQSVLFSALKALLPSSGHFQSTVNLKCLVESSTGQAVLMKVCVCNLLTQVLRDAKIEDVATVQSTICAIISVTAVKRLSELILVSQGLSRFDETVIELVNSIVRVWVSVLKVECPQYLRWSINT